MSSYHSSFDYLGKNSWEEGYIIAAFDADNGEKDSFLGMDQIYADTYNGAKRNLYGTKYNSVATIKITLLKANGSNWTVADNRSVMRWLTGSKNATWLDLYEDDKIKYSFLVTESNLSQYKIDARVVGIIVEFTSLSPWAFSAEQYASCSFGQELSVDENGTLYRGSESSMLSVKDGTLYAGPAEFNSSFMFLYEGVIYIDNSSFLQIDNQTDDLYTYINLDTKFINNDCDYLSIKNLTLDEETVIKNMQKNEQITLSSEQFIVSDVPNKIFGDDFNFVWPRIAPGINQISVNGGGKATIEFTYRYPIKIGDCAIDVYTLNGDCICEDGPGGNFGTVSWDDIVNTPETISGYGIKDAYNKTEIDYKIENVSIDEDELNDILADAFG